jgi:hypothetical protein
MYSAEKYYPQKASELLDLLSNSVIGKTKVAIVGGHFMLFYDKLKDNLQPVISQELENENQKKFAVEFAGNFPLRSFHFSVELFKQLNKRNIQSGILLLVNDHKFQSESFQKDISTQINGRGGELRQVYFRKNEIPSSYLATLKDNGFESNNILINNFDLKRRESDLLPKLSWYFSEQKLRKRFDKYVVPQLLKKHKVYQIKTGRGIDIFYQAPYTGTEICLTENGSCGCSAEVTVLISDLLSKGINEIIFFIPNECVNAVENGIIVSLNINEVAAKVITISGMGGMGCKENSKLPYAVVAHSFE